MTDISFSDIAIVSCGTMNLELNHLKKDLNSDIRIKRETAFAKEIPRNGIRNFYLTAVSCIWHRSVLG
jgi:hypothetical protein